MRVPPTELREQQQHSPKKGGGVSIHRDRGEHSSLPGSPFIVRSGADALRSHPVGLAPPRGPRPCAAAALPLSRGLPARALLRRPTWRAGACAPWALGRGGS